MKRLMTILVLCAGILLNVSAQDYTERLQQHKAGQGTVTIRHAADINQLVNNALLGARGATTSTTTVSGTTATPPSAASTASTASTSTASNATSSASVSSSSASADAPSETTAPVDNTKKIMRGYKVNGYRVQAFAGGNSRKDRQQAEQVGNDIKASFPGVPVYVHFYSPRWICRIGNYRTYEEAHQMLQSLKKMGYSQATIVKGKITVQY